MAAQFDIPPTTHHNTPSMTPEQFVQKWASVDLPERAASQEHFIDLCRVIGQPTPPKPTPPAVVISHGRKEEISFRDLFWCTGVHHGSNGKPFC
jgi:hypothetical protein